MQCCSQLLFGFPALNCSCCVQGAAKQSDSSESEVAEPVGALQSNAAVSCLLEFQRSCQL